MSGILTPGYLRWDGTKYVLDNDIEIIGPPGPSGPAGSTGPAGPPGPFGTATGDISGTYPGPMAVIGLTGIFGVVSFGSTITNPTITQTATGATTGQTMTYKAQNAATFGGTVALQSGTGTTAGLIQFLVGSNVAAYFDANQIFRIGPNANVTTTGPNGVSPLVGTDYIYGNNGSGSMLSELFSGSATQRAGYTAYNYAGGGASVSGLSMLAPGTTYSVTSYQGHGVLEQSGTATSAIVLSKVLGDGTSRAVTGRIFQSGAWAIGDTGGINSTSAAAQAGVTGPIINVGLITGGSPTSTAFQATIFNTQGTSPFGQLNLQAHSSVNLITNTTSIASTTISKFITSVGRRVRVRIPSAYPDTMTAADHVISVGAIVVPVTINLPAAPTAGDTYIIKDALANAGVSNITVSGNGSNIDGSATIVISTNYTEAMFVYTGTTWISSLTNNISPNTGYSSVVNVPSGGSVNVVGFDQLFVCDPTTNTCTVTAPATPAANLRFTVKDATAKSNVNAIIVNGNGRTLENPQNPGVYASPINIVTAALSATWAFDPTRNRYTVV